MKGNREPSTTTRLRYTPPYDWPAILAFFRARAIQGVEEVDTDVYRRAVVCAGHAGVVEIRQEPERNRLAVTTHFLPVTVLPALRSRIRRVFDLAASPQTIHEHLCRDAALAPFVGARPGLRVPGGWSDLEIAVRAILGQQITVVAARQLAGRLVALCGHAIPDARRSWPPLSHAFPSATQIIGADLDSIGMPAARRTALKTVARASLEDARLFRPSGAIETTVERLRAVRGIGEWTAQYIAMRASRDRDAFPATDVGLLRGAARVLGAAPTPADLLRYAEAWRPWRAYAAQHLWAIDAGSDRMAAKGDT